MESLKDLGDHIKKRRKSLRITQGALSQLSGTSLRSLKDVENGLGNPTWNQMQKIFKVLGWEFALRNASYEKPKSESFN